MDYQTVLEKEIKDLLRLAPPRGGVVRQSGRGGYDINLEFQNLVPREGLTISPLLVQKPLQLEPSLVIENLSLLQVSEFFCYHSTASGSEPLQGD